MLNRVILISCILLLGAPILAEANIEVHVNNLSVGTDSEKIQACRFLGKEKSEKKYVSEIQEILKATENSKVAVACANALGYIAEKGNSISVLKSKIMSESDSDIVYACLISIFSISLKNGYDVDAKSAVQYSDINHRQNEFVADLIDRIKVKFKD